MATPPWPPSPISSSTITTTTTSVGFSSSTSTGTSIRTSSIGGCLSRSCKLAELAPLPAAAGGSNEHSSESEEATGKGRKRQRVHSFGVMKKIPLLHRGDFEAASAGMAKRLPCSWSKWTASCPCTRRTVCCPIGA
eukprot:1030442-Pelagomonas_calceolata.AAC.1